MLTKFLEQVIQAGGNALEIEYRDGKEWVTAFRGPVGVGIGCLTPDEAKPLFKEMASLRKNSRITLSGKTHRLHVAGRESFGELVYRIEIR